MYSYKTSWKLNNCSIIPFNLTSLYKFSQYIKFQYENYIRVTKARNKKQTNKQTKQSYEHKKERVEQNVRFLSLSLIYEKRCKYDNWSFFLSCIKILHISSKIRFNTGCLFNLNVRLCTSKYSSHRLILIAV